ncbi:hypothetical protein Glove_456g11 [Diversispora epigaea]|uniref:SAM domain-containing protein n=1 Tax=Diversispora epigaea TaxID=1348612 RepID=A0A397GP97_9GLOM|nr:hypothetical protein Glove_456g11 [Diversispora epigaea]
MFDSIIDEYFNTTQSSNWSIPSVLKYVESKRYLYVDDISILKSEVYAVLRRHQNRMNMQQRAVSKLEKLLNNYDRLFSVKEIEQFINDLKKKEEEKDLHTSIRRNVTVVYNVEAEKDHHQNKAMLRKLHDNEDQVSKASSSNDQESDTERQDEITSDVVSDASDLCDDQMRELDDIEELEASGNKIKDGSEEKWTLSTGKDVYMVLNDPAYFGILDLSGEEPEVKELFTIEEWAEMQEDFSKTVVLKKMDSKEEELLYNLFDKIEEVLKRKSDDIITDIEECIIKGYPKINVIRRLIQTYSYNLDQLKVSMSEGSFSNNFTNMMTKGIITYNRKFAYDEGEIQSLSSAMIANLNKKPVDRSLIGQRCDFRITCDGFEAVIGLRSGGLPEACHSKKWNDKVDLMVAMRDVLLKEAIEDNGVECKDFRNLYTLGVHSYGFYYNLYALDWKAKGLWRLGLLKKIKLPQSNDQLLMIEKLTTLLLRVESTLDYIMPIRNELAVKASRLHRDRRSSFCLKPYTFAEQGQSELINFLRKQKLMLAERHFQVLRDEEIIGLAFLLMDERKFRDCGFKMGSAVVLMDIVNRINDD